jgi:diacylglycerol O-acyltransferase / wax synthase
MSPERSVVALGVEHLSPEDVTLWCAQATDAPLQIGGMALCDGAVLRDGSGAIPIDRIRRHVEARLVAAPRFRQVLRPVPLGQGLVWVDDAHFDIARHVRFTALPRPGSEEQLRELVARVLETPLAPDRPLWEFWVVEGVVGDRVALVPKVSHVVGDGMAVLGVVMSLFDAEPRDHDEPAQPSFTTAPPGTVPMLAGAAYRRGRRQLAAMWHVGRTLTDPTKVPGRVAAGARAGAMLLAPAPPLPITRPVGPRRDFAWVKLPLEPLVRVKRAEEVTLNDVVLTVVTDAVSRYLVRKGAATDRLRVVVPVSTHGLNPAGEIENRFSMMFVDLAVLPDPLERLRAVHLETTRSKSSDQTSLGASVLALGGLAPQRLLRAVAPRLLHHQPFVNLVVTNLAGPRQPLYLFGSRLSEMYPFVTVTGNLGLMVGVVSYTDTLGVGITVDADSVPDVADLARELEEAAAELVRATPGTSREP